MKIAPEDPINNITKAVIGAAIAVHRELGPGLLESTYEACLSYELTHRNVRFERQVPLPVKYREVRVDCGYRLDFLIDDQVIVEIKSVEKLIPVHSAQVITYLKLKGCRVGLLMNFNVTALRRGIRRLENHWEIGRITEIREEEEEEEEVDGQ